jgi:IS5 family transposase
VVVDTTVMEKAIAHPTDSRLYHRARERLVKLAREHGVPLRQSYARKSKQALHKAGRYGHAKQFRRMRREVKKLKNWLGRVVRDIERKIAGEPLLAEVFAESLALARRLLAQTRDSRGKLYSLHAPEVECIAKGKARKPYEFGVKVAVAVPVSTPFVIASQALPGNPYDGHTLYRTLTQCFKHTGEVVRRAFVDRGYAGSDQGPTAVHIAGKTRGLTRTLKRKLKRRNAIEPVIGHMKEDGRMDRNWLRGPQGDAMHALLCGAGQNLRLILWKLRLLFAWIFSTWLRVERAQRPPILSSLA